MPASRLRVRPLWRSLPPRSRPHRQPPRQRRYPPPPRYQRPQPRKQPSRQGRPPRPRNQRLLRWMIAARRTAIARSSSTTSPIRRRPPLVVQAVLSARRTTTGSPRSARTANAIHPRCVRRSVARCRCGALCAKLAAAPWPRSSEAAARFSPSRRRYLLEAIEPTEFGHHARAIDQCT